MCHGTLLNRTSKYQKEIPAKCLLQKQLPAIFYLSIYLSLSIYLYLSLNLSIYLSIYLSSCLKHQYNSLATQTLAPKNNFQQYFSILKIKLQTKFLIFLTNCFNEVQMLQFWA